MGCRIEIWPVDKDGTLTYVAARGRKFRLFDNKSALFLTNRSGTAFLEYGSRKAASRGHDKHCQHYESRDVGSSGKPLPQIDGRLA